MELIFILLYGTLLLVSIASLLFFVHSLFCCLTEVQESNRSMSPWVLWLNVLPFINLVCLPYSVLMLKKSLLNEYASRGFESKYSDMGGILGMSAYLLYLVSNFIPMIGFITGLISMVLWISYWVMMVRIKKELIALKMGNGSIVSESP